MKDIRSLRDHFHLKREFLTKIKIDPNVLKSVRGRDWTIGKPLGQGGFGAIYLVQLGEHKKVDDGAEYVVKVDKSFFLE